MSFADTLISSSDSLAYWNKTPSTVSGMLGGFPQVSRIDITGSRTFLVKLLRISNPCPTPAPGKKLSHVADTGAGIGRITRNLLAPLASHIDVVEPVQKFTDQLRIDATELFTHEQKNASNSSNTSNITTTTTTTTTTDPSPSPSQTTASTINHPLESWQPPLHPTYDLIWNQWCLGHLTDTQLTNYLRRLTPSLQPGGWIVVKENVLGDGKRVFPRAVAVAVAVAASSSLDTAPKRGGNNGAGDDDDDDDNGDAVVNSDDDQQPPTFDIPDLYDDEDSSVTRSAGKFEWIFAQAGLRVVRTEVQRGFGRELGLFPVRMWGLRPVGGFGGGEGVEDGE